MSILNKKFKKTLLLTALGTSLLLTGCSGKEKNKSEVSDTTNLLTTVEIVNEDINNNKDIYTTLAQESYNEYKEFYDSIDVSVPQIENMIKIIKDDLSNISEDNLIDTIDIINQILLSDQLCQSLDNIDFGMKNSFNVSQLPKLSIYVENEKIKQNLESYEMVRNQITNSANNGVITEEDKMLLKNSIINMEQAYNEDQGYMNSTVICEGNKYLQESWKKHLVVLAAKVTGETEVIDQNGEIYPICTNGEETNVIAQYNMLSANGDNIPESIQMQYVDIKLRQIITKYEQGMCSIEEELYRRINKPITDETLGSRKKYILEQKKFALESYQCNQNANNNKKIMSLQI